MTASFVHLSLHSEYSLADSVVRVKPLITAVRDRGMLAIQGRLDSTIADALLHYRVFYRNGTHVLLHSRDREKLDVLTTPTASWSRADGEWLMDLVEQEYD